MGEVVNKVPYRPITVIDLSELIGKYADKSSYEVAVKLLVDEELLILCKA